MSAETVFSNARVVLEDRIIDGSVVINDGMIVDIDEGVSSVGDDFDGDYLLPGLIELHTDHIEGHYAPRPRVKWNPHAAVLAHDAQIAASGITTVFDALRLGMDEQATEEANHMRLLADAIDEGLKRDRLRADHFIHLRCEVSASDCVDAFRQFENDERVKLASLMDHSPGQRQFANPEAYRVYYQGKTGMSDEAFEAFSKARIEASEKYSNAHRVAIAEACHERGIVLASHDDATIDHVNEALEQGIRVAEFPTTEEAAKASHDGGLAVLMGAPNVVRGGSHSGNVAAQRLAEKGHLDILSSDYIPFSLIQAVFHLCSKNDELALTDTVKMVSANPAKAVSLDDRGSIDVGKRADLIRVRVDDDAIPVIRSVWRQGSRVL
ncbi:MAG: alpha-D-ribose 1-methylphosphonate 5-triphosphate diphosphatase [Pseudomonadota bacterium]